MSSNAAKPSSTSELQSDAARSLPTPLEAMSLRILGLVSVEGAVFTAENLLDNLHGRTTPESQHLAIEALRCGFEHLSTSARRIPFARLCIELGNFEILERVVRAGPPQIPRFETLGDSPAAWLDWLCSLAHAGRYASGIAQSNGFDTVLQTLGPDSVKLLRLAHDLDPAHRCLVMEAQGSDPVRDEMMHPGNLHYALLHHALNGSTSTSQVHSEARRRTAFKMHDHGRGLEMHAAALECLAFLRSVGSVPWPGEKIPLDAKPFVTAFNLGSRYVDVRALMEAYRDMGALDIDAAMHPTWRAFGGKIPIDVAISAGSPGAAAALIDMGCNVDPSTVAQSHGGDLVAMAAKSDRPEVLAAVVDALMRRRLSGPASAAPAPDAAAAPQLARRRSAAI